MFLCLFLKNELNRKWFLEYMILAHDSEFIPHNLKMSREKDCLAYLKKRCRPESMSLRFPHRAYISLISAWCFPQLFPTTDNHFPKCAGFGVRAVECSFPKFLSTTTNVFSLVSSRSSKLQIRHQALPCLRPGCNLLKIFQWSTHVCVEVPKSSVLPRHALKNPVRPCDVAVLAGFARLEGSAVSLMEADIEM
jgi:hypothetical protein